jgi:hypothetical protein
LGNYVSIIIVPSLGTHISKPGIYVSVNQVGLFVVAFVLVLILFIVTGYIVYCISVSWMFSRVCVTED